MIVTLVMALIGLWRIKFWPKIFMVMTVFISAALLICFGFAEEPWKAFLDFMGGKNFLLPVFFLFASSILVYTIQSEKEKQTDLLESKSDAAFSWFMLAIASAVIAFASIIILTYHFEWRWFIWVPIMIAYVVYAAICIDKMNSDKRRQMLFISLSLYAMAITGLTLIILT